MSAKIKQCSKAAELLPSSKGVKKGIIGLKVHKIEIFLASVLKFVLFLYYLCQNIKILPKNFLIGPLLGDVRFFRVVLGLRRMKKKFELGPNFFSLHL